jgi:hypothetical protein
MLGLGYISKNPGRWAFQNVMCSEPLFASLQHLRLRRNLVSGPGTSEFSVGRKTGRRLLLSRRWILVGSIFARSSKPAAQQSNKTATKNEDGRTVPPLSLCILQLRHYELTGIDPTGCELKNTLFWLRWG